jgi:hypothetical protein
MTKGVGLSITPRRLFIRIILVLLSCLAAVRLAGFGLRFSTEALQMDFSSYFTAGESLNHAFSPYVNLLPEEPGLWDGIDLFQHSRFLYPPLVATFFRPIALIPYAIAKFGWTMLTLLLTGVAMATAASLSKITLRFESVMVIAIFTMLFHPLLTHLERGQIDIITFTLLMLALAWMVKRERSDLAGGAAAAAATLFKLHCVFIVPFLFLRKRGKVLAGYAGGVMLILLLSLAFNGYGQNHDYVFNQMPRIAVHGEIGPEETRLDQRYLEGRELGEKGGRQYEPEGFSFTANATLIRPLHNTFRKAAELTGLPSPGMTAVAMLVFTALFSIMALFQWRFRDRFDRFTAMQEFAYWQLVLVIILLSSPLTWVMNTIWLMPVAVIIIYWSHVVNTRTQAAFLAVGVIGLLLAALPDPGGFPLLIPYGSILVRHKYVLAELLILVSLLSFLTGSFGEEEGRPAAIRQHSSLLDNPGT